MIRSLLALLMVILTLSASGLSSAIAYELSEDDDCCTDGAENKAQDSRSRGDAGGGPERCPPLCHGCACSPTFAVPSVLSVVRVALLVHRRTPIFAEPRLPASLFGDGVFHPPRS